MKVGYSSTLCLCCFLAAGTLYAFEFSFTGTEIVWMGSKGPWGGDADACIDGKLVSEVNPYAPKPQLNVELFKRSGLPHAEHTIRIVCQARWGHPDGMEPYINLDAFEYK